jgi:hypothetical protein
MICVDSACMGYDPVFGPVYIKMSSDTHQVTYQLFRSQIIEDCNMTFRCTYTHEGAQFWNDLIVNCIPICASA